MSSSLLRRNPKDMLIILVGFKFISITFFFLQMNSKYSLSDSLTSCGLSVISKLQSKLHLVEEHLSCSPNAPLMIGLHLILSLLSRHLNNHVFSFHNAVSIFIQSGFSDIHTDEPQNPAEVLTFTPSKNAQGHMCTHCPGCKMLIWPH